MTSFTYRRRDSWPVAVAGVAIGGQNPVRVQSMASTSTMDTEGSVDQARRIIDAGAELLRFTAQGVREAANLGEIRQRLRAEGLTTPLVADIHFNPRAAFEAARHVEKVRINPGNFVDPGRTFKKIEFTDEEYAAELQRIEDALVPFLDLCRENSTAIRIGVNHGSLSDRIMSRYGDTPAGMVESAMEFLRVCVRHGFRDVVISIKASNVGVMVETMRRLVAAMDAEDMHFPLHLGVTEAGDGEDGRIKSAVGIGTLLAEGIGDTIRVSLSEPPECEIPVARAIVDIVGEFEKATPLDAELSEGYDPVAPRRRMSAPIAALGSDSMPAVIGADSAAEYDDDCRPDLFLDSPQVKFRRIKASQLLDSKPDFAPEDVILLSSDSANPVAEMRAAFHALVRAGVTNPVVLAVSYDDMSADEATLRAAIHCGAVMMAGFGDGLLIEGNALTPARAARVAFAILQSCRLRFSHTEFISCPGCGRTLFDLQSTLADVKRATSHLKGLKIGVMGCIVNGPGEMADADYGYVGAGAGRISLYRGKECVEKNIPAHEAVEHLVELIKADGNWK
ncbi:MAG: (E)-4-hydroxy-3-methylbut-2-enyl-diphosphate synthase [Bacteroides sp.]|nr:(E)-4-hydroxy-3-methylbut-2-enyl-diphosphate synthase [Bacteroides sp.]